MQQKLHAFRYAELYPNHRYSSAQQVINIERTAHKYITSSETDKQASKQ